MSKITCFKVEEPFKNNRLFVQGDFLDFFYDTKIKLEKIGFKVGTHDLVNEKKADYIIYCDYRKDFIDNRGIKILLAMESIAVIPKTFKKSYLDKFDYVFTWNEEIIDNINPDDIHYPVTNLVALENTINRGGGICYPITEIEKISADFSYNE